MKPVQHFPRQLNDFLSCNFGSMQHRIPAATLPYTCRKLSRKHDRTPSVNRKGCRLFFGTAILRYVSKSSPVPELPDGFVESGCCVSVETSNRVWKYSQKGGTPLLLLLAMADWSDDWG